MPLLIIQAFPSDRSLLPSPNTCTFGSSRAGVIVRINMTSNSVESMTVVLVILVVPLRTAVGG